MRGLDSVTAPSAEMTDEGAVAAVGLPPSPPTLSEFGLSEESVSQIPKTVFAFLFANFGSEKNYPFWLVYWTAHAIAFFSIFYQKGMEVSFKNVVGFLGFGILFIVPFMVGSTILGELEKSIRSGIGDHFKNYLKYLEARSNFVAQKISYDREVAAYNAKILKKQEEYWRSLSGIMFEVELGKLFSLMGYEVKLTSSTSDGGVDIILRKSGRLTVVQCKAHSKRIPIGTARELCASIVDFNADDAIIACFEGVTKPVEDYIRDKPVTILDLKEIIALQRQYG